MARQGRSLRVYIARRVVRETCKFFTTRAENLVGRRRTGWESELQSRRSMRVPMETLLRVFSAMWAPGTALILRWPKLAIWVAHLPKFNAPEFMKVVELDSTGPQTAYTKEFLECPGWVHPTW